MLITVNSNKKEIDANTVLANVLNNFRVNGDKGLAVAVNNKIVPKTIWNDFIMNENDNVLIIRASQGG